MIRRVPVTWTVVCISLIFFSFSYAQQPIYLTLDSAIELAMRGSYRIKQLELGIDRTQSFLRSRKASLKSKVTMKLQAPTIRSVSETKWNSTLQKDEIIRENTSRWQMDLAVSQPVILFGYPTNGYLSLNYQLYRYLQKDGEENLDYYNHYFVKFEQPLFQPNSLKNNLEDAELDLERSELEYLQDKIGLIDDIADDYYDLFRVVFRDKIFKNTVLNLETILEIVGDISKGDTTQNIEYIQVKVELANAREQMYQNMSSIRNESNRIKQRLQLGLQDSVYLDSRIRIVPINVDLDEAIEYGFSMSPRLRVLDINKRKNEIDLNNAKGWDAFRLNLEMTYGLEKKRDEIEYIWNDYDDSHSVSLSAYLPIWDWGRRDERVNAYKISVEKSKLYIDENKEQIRSNIIQAVQNLDDYQRRVLNLQSSRDMVQELTNKGINQYENNIISIQDLLQMINRQQDTELNFLDAYLGYRRSLIWLMIQTYYDYENDISILKKYSDSSY